MITIHGMLDSGNCYKPRLLCALTGRAFRHREVSMLDGGTRRPGFLALNPVGQVPLLELEDGRTLPESNAILLFLGDGTAFVPADPLERARMTAWMFFEQNAHEINVAGRRSLTVYPERASAATPERMALTLANGTRALQALETRLSASPYLVGKSPSLADIALYPYTATAPEGGFDLAPLPAVRDWIARIEALPGYRPRHWLPEG